MPIFSSLAQIGVGQTQHLFKYYFEDVDGYRLDTWEWDVFDIMVHHNLYFLELFAYFQLPNMKKVSQEQSNLEDIDISWLKF